MGYDVVGRRLRLESLKRFLYRIAGGEQPVKSGEVWAIGIDLGGTKTEVARIDASGSLGERLRHPTPVKDGPQAVRKVIVAAVQNLRGNAVSPPVGVGVGLAGQIDPEHGMVRIDQGVRRQALSAATQSLHILPAQLKNDVGVIGAAVLAMRLFSSKEGFRNV